MRKWKKLGLFLGLFFLFLPQILSLPLLNQAFFYLIKKTSGLQIQAQNTHFSYLAFQKFKKIKIQAKNFQFNAEELILKKSFFSLFSLKKENFFSSQPTLRITNGKLRLFKTSLNQINGFINCSAHGLKFDLTAQNQIAGKIFFQGFAQKKAKTAKGNFKLYKLPSKILDDFFQTDNLITSLIGKNFDACISFHVKNSQGPLNIDLVSDYYQGKLPLIYSPNQITLQENICLNLSLSSRRLGSEFQLFSMPYFKTLIPITLNIDKEGFVIPLPFDLEKLRLKGVLNLGKIKISNTKNLALFIKLLKEPKLANSKKIALKFSPANINVQKGFLNVSSLNIFLGPLPISAAGNLNLSSNKIDMYLGLPAELLKKRFKIYTLPANYMLSLPLSGSLKKIKLNKKETVGKIARLISLQQKTLLKPLLKNSKLKTR